MRTRLTRSGAFDRISIDADERDATPEMPELPDIDLYLHALRPRLGKRIVWHFEGDLYFVFHLMIAGRFQWKEYGAKIPARLGLAAFDLPGGTLLLTEAGSSRRASLYVVGDAEVLADMDPGGLYVFTADLPAFSARLLS